MMERVAGLIALLGFGPAGWGGLLLSATLMTLAVSVAALLVGALLGAAAAAAKLSGHRWLRGLGGAYTTVFRGLPELLVIYMVYFGGSALVTSLAEFFRIPGFAGLPVFAAGALAVGVISGAYQAEVFRSAYLAIAPGELEAARSVGMPLSMRWRRIAMPQVLAFAMPGIGNVWQLTLKDSALISVTGLAEIMQTAQTGAGSTRQYLVFYVVGAALYLGLTAVSGGVLRRAERRLERKIPSGARAAPGALSGLEP
jgi:octopine/nopaline transport system permease protein